MEEFILFPEWFLLIPDMRLSDLEGHILVRHLRNRGKEEHKGEDKNKDADGKVDPLDVFEGVHVIRGISKEDVRGQCGRNTSPDSVECLC